MIPQTDDEKAAEKAKEEAAGDVEEAATDSGEPDPETPSEESSDS